ncbi:MAG: arylsulfatase [Pseudomonadota bacterium]
MHSLLRKTWLPGMLLLAGAVMAATPAATPLAKPAAGSAAKGKPNIVLLLADDWGFSDVGSFGGEIATPNIDDLARRGMRFSNFHVSASCSPTRAMLLTGVDNHRNGVGNMRETIPQSHVGKPGYLSVLDTNVVTVASLLRDGGYRTYVAGKWHVGKEPHNLPPARGFDRSIIQADSGSDNWETGKRYLDLAEKVNWFEDGKEAVMPADYYSSKFFVDKAIEYIDAGAKDKKPFFAYVAFQANHIPVQAPAGFIAKYKGRYDKGWTALREERRDRAIALGLIPKDTPMVTMSTTADWDALSEQDKKYQARRMEVYAAMADAMDFHVGRLVAHLKQTGEYDNTVFLFMSDNGSEASDPYAVLAGRLWLDWKYNKGIDQLGAKGAYSIIGPSWGSAVASPLSTYKFYSGEGGIRVPLIIAGANGMQQNRINGSLAHVNDIVPTLLELAQLPHPGTSYRGKPVEPLTGSSLMPVLTGQAARVHAPDKVIGYELSGNEAVFKGDLKLIRNIAPVGDGRWHLYDISNDPGETRDLQTQMPDVFKTMQADYAAWAKANGVLPMPDGYDPIRQVQINALVNVYVPRFKRAAVPIVAGLVLLTLAVVFVCRRRRTRPL